jgi:hypothetical protein
MLYFVESDLSDRTLEMEWHAWYDSHIQRLLTVPGFLSGQRFLATHSTASPFAAIYGIKNAGVMSSETYRARFGPNAAGVWKQRMTNWKRNLLEGIDELPDLSADSWLAVIDRYTTGSAALPSNYTSTRPVGLDHSVVERGLLLGTNAEKPPTHFERDGWSLRIFRPLTPKITATAD